MLNLRNMSRSSNLVLVDLLGSVFVCWTWTGDRLMKGMVLDSRSPVWVYKDRSVV